MDREKPNVIQPSILYKEKVSNQRIWDFLWQGYLDEDRTFYSVGENGILVGRGDRVSTRSSSSSWTQRLAAVK